MGIDAEKIGQLLLMQSVVVNISDRKTVITYIERGISAIPGVKSVIVSDSVIPENADRPELICHPVSFGDEHLAEVVIEIDDRQAFEPYSEYVRNYIFTIGIFFEEKHQRKLNLEYKDQLELRVEERTQQLKNEILEREKVEEFLRASEERFRLTMLAANDGMFDLDVPSKKVTYSDRWYSMLGYSPDEFKGHYDDWRSLLHPDDAKEVEKIVLDNINSKTRWQAEFRMRAKDGSYRWILSRGLCVESDLDGKPVRVIGTHTDITSRKETEMKLLEYQEHLEQIVQERTKDIEEKKTDLEDAMASAQEAQGQLILYEKMGALRHLVAGIAHEINNPLGAIESSREIFTSSVSGILKEVPRLAQWLQQPYAKLILELIDGSRNISTSAIMKSTREKRLIRDQFIELFKIHNIEDGQMLARKVVEMHVYDDIERFIPLFKSEEASEILDVISEFADAFAASETVKTAVTRTAKIVSALNSYMRKDVDFSSGESMKVNLDIRHSLENVLVLFQNVITNYIDLEVIFDNELPLVYGASDELNQVWTNIIQNAIQAMDGKGRLVITGKVAPGGLVVSFTDEGSGMTEEVKQKVFEPLFTTKPPGEGLGLGMDIVRKIVVDNHKGSINIDSEPGKGTTVSVFLPVDNH